MSRGRFALRSVARAGVLALLSAPVLLLTACGGGGGDGDAPAAPAAASQLAITDGNQQAVAAEAVQVTDQGTSVASLGSSLATGAQVDAAVRGPVVLGAVVPRLLARVPNGPALATGVTQTETQACTGGGSATLSVTTSGGSSLVAGDSVSIVTNNCVENIDGSNVRLNGRLAVAVTAGSFDPVSATYPKDVTLRMTADNFALDTVSMAGTLELHLLQTSALLNTVAVSSPSFAWKVTTTAGTSTLTLKDYSQRVQRSNVDVVSIQVAATVETNNPRLGGALVRYTISTPDPVVVNTLAGGMLVRGSVKVVGKSSALLVTVTDNNTLQLQLDANGDGTSDSTRTLSRFAL